MSRHSFTILVSGLFMFGALTQLCDDDSLDLCYDLPGSPDLFTCDSDEMDLCVETMCDTDALDLCDDDTSTTSSADLGSVITTTGTTPQMIVKRGVFNVNVDATAPQVKASTEKALGKLLFDQGVGSSAPEAAGYVMAEVKTARRLSEFTRRLASTAYVVNYTISVPNVADVSANVDVALNAIKADPTKLQAEMVTQFAAANVGSATTVTITNFEVHEDQENNTNGAPRSTGRFSTMLLVFSCLLSTKGLSFVLAAFLN